jgi:hypothetical protein
MALSSHESSNCESYIIRLRLANKITRTDAKHQHDGNANRPRQSANRPREASDFGQDGAVDLSAEVDLIDDEREFEPTDVS